MNDWVDDMLPCPFCGSTDTSDETVNAVGCLVCGGAIHLSYSPGMKDGEQVRAWNRRAPHPDTARMDWLEKHPVDVYEDRRYNAQRISADGPDLRAKIDALMQKGRG